ncbi:MAG TPA: D-alanyl-D-alanine carboxypeptidase, partial [Eudoraea sp.]|nr:D-alanyl-D-alanine carboxypeptidase [Eudoraea sp.]
MNSFKKCCSFLLAIIVLSACASAGHRKFKREIGRTLAQTVFENHFAGIMVYDPLKGDTLFSRNSDKYFTPASNTKIFTLYGALKLLPERVPVLEYCLENDTLYFTGMGDPTQLHPYFKDSTLITFLKGFENHAMYLHNFQDEKYGPGWAWEDYDGYYAPERSALPLYGNVITVNNSQGLSVVPAYFKDSVVPVAYTRRRYLNTNTFFFGPLQKDTLEIPFITSNNLTQSLLEKATGLHISQVSRMPELERKTVYGIRSD